MIKRTCLYTNVDPYPAHPITYSIIFIHVCLYISKFVLFRLPALWIEVLSASGVFDQTQQD